MVTLSEQFREVYEWHGWRVMELGRRVIAEIQHDDDRGMRQLVIRGEKVLDLHQPVMTSPPRKAMSLPARTGA
jgi:hypothetical protein